MSNKKQSSVIQIRNWIRTNGDMSADGKTITYRCNELDALLEQAYYIHKEEIERACNQQEFEDIDGFGIHETITKGEQYYNETYGE